jgi:PAS domain-containing protein
MTPEMTLNDSLAADSVLDGKADGVFALNSDFRITSFNRAAERVIGVDRGPALGRLCRNVLSVSAQFSSGVCFGAALFYFSARRMRVHEHFGF